MDLNLSTSHVVLAAQGEFMQPMMKTINGMMLEMLAACDHSQPNSLRK